MKRNSYSQFTVTSGMPKPELLPGVTADRCPPSTLFGEARLEIRKAKRNAFLRDALQLGLVASVNYLFFHWPASRLPFADRAQSEILLAAITAAVVTSIWLTRMLPRWSARRTAATWSRQEQEQFKRLATPGASRRIVEGLRRR